MQNNGHGQITNSSAPFSGVPIIASLAGVGVPKLVLFNGHGGNDFKQMLRELQAKWPQVFLSTVFWANIDAGADIFEVADDHADEKETSMMLHIHPELVLPKEDWGDGITHSWRLHGKRHAERRMKEL